MAKITLVLITILAAILNSETATSETAGSVQLRIIRTTGTTTPAADVYVNTNADRKVNYFVYATSTTAWSQAYAGIIWNLRKNKSARLSLGAGLETGSWRTGAHLFITHRGVTLLSIAEAGRKSWTHRTVLTAQVTKVFGLGLAHIRGMGTGPMLQVNIGSLQLWGTPLWEGGERSVMTGLRVNL